ncbi:MAG: anthranilate synthase component II [Bacteroidia bacterium]
MRVLLIDNYDSFTYNLLHQLQLLGLNCSLVRNDDAHFDWEHIAADVLVYSPGPCTPAEAGRLNWLIARYHQQIPMLGICLGHQALGVFFGAKLSRAPLPMHGKVSLLRQVADSAISKTGDTWEVMRYHSLVLEDLPECLEALAYAETDHCLMAFRHREWPIYGLQFHPESVLTHNGLEILRAFFNEIRFIGIRNATL